MKNFRNFFSIIVPHAPLRLNNKHLRNSLRLTHQIDDFSSSGGGSRKRTEIEALPINGCDEGSAKPHTCPVSKWRESEKDARKKEILRLKLEDL